jgi:hypothetical protein
MIIGNDVSLCRMFERPRGSANVAAMWSLQERGVLFPRLPERTLACSQGVVQASELHYSRPTEPGRRLNGVATPGNYHGSTGGKKVIVSCNRFL